MTKPDTHNILASELAPMGAAKLRQLETEGHRFVKGGVDVMSAVCLMDAKTFAQHGRPAETEHPSN